MASYFRRVLRLPESGQAVLAPPRWLMRRPEAGEGAPGSAPSAIAPAPAPPPWQPAGSGDPAVRDDPAASRGDLIGRPVRRIRTAPAQTPVAADHPVRTVTPGRTPTTMAVTVPATPHGPDRPTAASAVLSAAAASSAGGRAGAAERATAPAQVQALPAGAVPVAAVPIRLAPVSPAPVASAARPSLVRAAGGHSPTLRIGAIEVVVVPPPTATPSARPAPAGRSTSAAARLSRGFPSGFGLRQG